MIMKQTTEPETVGNILKLHVLAQVNALVMYWHNTESEELLNQVYHEPAPSYAEEKEKIWQHGLTAFYGQLDDDHRWRLIEAAWAKYGEETTRRLGVDQDIACDSLRLTDEMDAVNEVLKAEGRDQ